MSGTFKEEWAKIEKFCKSEEYQEKVNRAGERFTAKPFVMYGAGAEGLEFATVFQSSGITPLAFCDTYRKGVEPFSKLPIISPADLLVKNAGADIIISTSMYKTEIENYLAELGVKSDRILPRSLWFNLCLRTAGYAEPGRGSHYALTFNALNKMLKGQDDELLAGYERTYNRLADEKSKKVLTDRIRFCLTGELIEYDPLDTVYFDKDLIKLSDSEVFLDAGMYTADTAEAFFDNTGNKYAYYYGFEPDAETYQKACEFLRNRANFSAVNKGLWSFDATLKFDKQYVVSCSKISDTGADSIDVVSVDSFIADKHYPPTLIKMDIEGSELEALKGAENTIKKYRPRLMICVYHKPEDIYTLPEIINSFRGDYAFYMRHYTDTICDTVLYAV